MRIGPSLALGPQYPAGSSVFDPATLGLEGWWRADYAASPWVGTASAGGSGARDLTEATNPPIPGTLQNGFAPALFDGVDDEIGNASALYPTFVTDAAGTIWFLFRALVAGADAGAGLRFLNQGMLCQSGGGTSLNLTFSTSGVAIDAFDSIAWREVNLACSAASYHLALARWDVGTLGLRVDSGVESTVAAGSLMGAGALALGRNFAVNFCNFELLDVGLMKTRISDTNSANLITYANSRYALAL